MTQLHKQLLLLIIIFTTGLSGLISGAVNRRHITTHDGLSNMAVLSFMQDHDGYIWAATCDGVNMIENTHIISYGAGNNGRNEFSGNLVETISQDDNNVMWVHTNYGLDRYDLKDNTIHYFRNINGWYRDALSPDGNMIVQTSTDSLMRYDNRSGRFRSLGTAPVTLSHVKVMTYDSDGRLIIVSDKGFIGATVTDDTETPAFREILSDRLRSAKLCDGHIYYITESMDLWDYNLTGRKATRITHLPDEVGRRGDISAISADGQDFIIGFKTNGAVRLTPAGRGDYRVEPLDIDCGVFAVYKDKRQDILWVGTDGDGIYYYMPEPYRFFSQTTTGSGRRISKPVRAILSDKDGNVWIGTKGDGLYCYNSFRPFSKNDNTTHYTAANSELPDNDIYALASSRRPLLWIGTQGHGLNYYSYDDRRIHHLDIPMMNRLQSVHAIYEVSADELYIATVGEGIFHITLEGSISSPVIASVTETIYDATYADANAFFSITPQNRNVTWFGNRGFGAFRYDNNSGSYSVIDLSSAGGPVANDVFGIYARHSQPDSIYCASSIGLIGLYRDKGAEEYEVRLIPSTIDNAAKTVHAILPGLDNDMLVTTNAAITRYSFPELTSVTYTSGSDFEVIQFSDAAAYRDAENGIMYFGGANGFVAVVPTGEALIPYSPDVLFRSIMLGNDTEILDRYLDKEGRLVLDHDQNDFIIHFGVLDYSHGASYAYRYRLMGASDKWVNNTSGDVSFTNLGAGDYVLEVSYHNGHEWSEPYRLPIIIKPPFYASTTAYVIYFILLVAGVICLLIVTVRIQHRKRNAIVKTLEQKRKEDVYEAKLKFFTNITHELFTPLTLINGSCERMLADTKLSQQNHRLTSAIHKNSTRLTELIQELIEFRRIDTEYRRPDVEELDVTSIITDIADNFSILTERKGIHLTQDIQPEVMWPSDKSGFVTIVNNLVSNALKYTPADGEITIGLSADDNYLTFTVSNTGEGIAPENINQIFDRYKVLERFERLSATGTIKRNGLGLAVCDGLVKILGGTIKVESRQGEVTTFTVILPRIEITRDKPSADNINYCKSTPMLPDNDEDDTTMPQEEEEERQSTKPLIYVVDDDKDMLWFVADSLRDTYKVQTYENAEAALEALRKAWPSAIICDVLMEGMGGIEFVRTVKSDKSTAHIPVIQLSSLHSEEDKIRSLEAGADIYVTKPFKIEYLRTVITRLLQRKENLKEYFDSSISSFKKIDGQILHNDDQDFIERITAVIEENITNPELSTKFIAEALHLSVRNLYRRLEGITEQTPTLIIKEMRLNMAKQMLAHTSLSIDEILYKSGFNNRGTFFKLFQQKFGSTPKQYREAHVAEAKSKLGIS